MSAPAASPTPQSGPGPAVPASAAPPASDRPEILAAGAFAGGFLLATILRRLG